MTELVSRLHLIWTCYWPSRSESGSAVWLQVKVRDRGFRLQPRLYAGPVWDDSTAEAAYAAVVALYKLTLPLPLAFTDHYEAVENAVHTMLASDKGGTRVLRGE